MNIYPPFCSVAKITVAKFLLYSVHTKVTMVETHCLYERSLPKRTFLVNDILMGGERVRQGWAVGMLLGSWGGIEGGACRGW